MTKQPMSPLEMAKALQEHCYNSKCSSCVLGLTSGAAVECIIRNPSVWDFDLLEVPQRDSTGRES